MNKRIANVPHVDYAKLIGKLVKAWKTKNEDRYQYGIFLGIKNNFFIVRVLIDGDFLDINYDYISPIDRELINYGE